jgi:hypothetical protein
LVEKMQFQLSRSSFKLLVGPLGTGMWLNRINSKNTAMKCLSESTGPKQATVHTIQITVHKIDGFSDTAGFMDRTDPYVLLQLGKEKQQTSVKNDVSE